MAERTTVVIVTWRGRDHLTACLDAVAAQTRAHRTLVVDNDSQDGTIELIKSHHSKPEVMRLSRNAGYAGGISEALTNIRTPLVAWLNDDAAPEPGWLSALEDALDSGAAAASSVLYSPGGHVQSLGVQLTADGHGADTVVPSTSGSRCGPVPGYSASTGHVPGSRLDSESGSGPESGSGSAGPDSGLDVGHGSTAETTDGLPSGARQSISSDPIPEVFGFCGGAVLLRTERLRAIGGVPSEFFCYYEDTDTSWRLRLAGEHVVTALNARARHRHGASTRPGSSRFHRWNERNRLLMLLRCAPRLVAARHIARFAAITLALPLRRIFGRTIGNTPNFRIGLRLRVLIEVAALLPVTLRARRRIARHTKVSRREIWHEWAGH